MVFNQIMDYELPTEFDLVVLGTGMIESIVAAAASRIGKRVLHIDSNNYYGGLWASFNLDSVNKLHIDNEQQVELDKKDLVKESEVLHSVGNNLFNLKIQSLTWNIPEKLEEKDVKDQWDKGDTKKVETKEAVKENWSQENLLNLSRKFNIDLTPKLHFARGDFVELLISSNIARYSEFRSVSRVLTWLNGQPEIVPCSRSDVFSSDKVSVIEKRMLMKLFTSVDGDKNEFVGYENKTFQTFLKDRKLTGNLIHYVLYAIAMCTDDTPCLEGIKNTKRFLSSLGRFGKTPFLYSMYGSGEITQAFCRLSAVFGGIYALNQPLCGIIFDNESKFSGILCGSQRINAEHLVIGFEKMPKNVLTQSVIKYISRAIFITDRSIMECDKEHLTLLLFPPINGKNPCTILELGSLTGTCPKNNYLVHMFAKQEKTPEEDFKHCVENLFYGQKESIPNILWSFYYSVPDTSDVSMKFEHFHNMYVCVGPDMDLDFDPAVAQAKRIFNEIYPNWEFLPRAPDPEEIIIEEEDNNNLLNEDDNNQREVHDENESEL